MSCKFIKSWVGKCGKDAVEGSEYCEEHSATKCSVCGKQATQDCGETYQFVCGAPLCDNCTCRCITVRWKPKPSTPLGADHYTSGLKIYVKTKDTDYSPDKANNYPAGTVAVILPGRTSPIIITRNGESTYHAGGWHKDSLEKNWVEITKQVQ